MVNSDVVTEHRRDTTAIEKMERKPRKSANQWKARRLGGFPLESCNTSPSSLDNMARFSGSDEAMVGQCGVGAEFQVNRRRSLEHEKPPIEGSIHEGRGTIAGVENAEFIVAEC